MTRRTEGLVDLLREAATLEYGLFIATTNASGLRTNIRDALREAGETPESLGVMICTPAIEGALFFVRRSLELDPP